MARIQLVHLAHARSGDKGDTANVGVIAYRCRMDSGSIELRDAIEFRLA